MRRALPSAAAMGTGAVGRYDCCGTHPADAVHSRLGVDGAARGVAGGCGVLAAVGHQKREVTGWVCTWFALKCQNPSEGFFACSGKDAGHSRCHVLKKIASAAGKCLTFSCKADTIHDVTGEDGKSAQAASHREGAIG